MGRSDRMSRNMTFMRNTAFSQKGTFDDMSEMITKAKVMSEDSFEDSDDRFIQVLDEQITIITGRVEKYREERRAIQAQTGQEIQKGQEQQDVKPEDNTAVSATEDPSSDGNSGFKGTEALSASKLPENTQDAEAECADAPLETENMPDEQAETAQDAAGTPGSEEEVPQDTEESLVPSGASVPIAQDCNEPAPLPASANCGDSSREDKETIRILSEALNRMSALCEKLAEKL